MAIRRRPVPTTKDILSRENLLKNENKTMLEGGERKARRTAMQVMQEAREKIEKERLQQEKYNQKVEESELIEEGEEEVMISNNQDTIQEDNLESFTASKSKAIPKISTEAGASSIINSKNGKRITFSGDVMIKLNNPEVVSISFSDDSLAVAERLPNNDNQFKVRSIGKKGVIYSAGLVSEVTDKYRLDFSNRTSITFTEVNYVKSNGNTVAIIKIR
ncbi:hypothetical protein ACQPU1_16925 [Clostridium paraputrificum]|uniref:hypothetical protein n=1 Tax=Clostridium paraputrificum TaxID=29363 RepID=UPI003D341825